MPYKKGKKEKKYTLVIRNIPEGYFNEFVYCDDIHCGKFMSDYSTIDEVSQVIKSIPKVCVVKVYRCSIDSIVTDEIDSELEIKIN